MRSEWQCQQGSMCLVNPVSCSRPNMGVGICKSSIRRKKGSVSYRHCGSQGNGKGILNPKCKWRISIQAALGTLLLHQPRIAQLYLVTKASGPLSALGSSMQGSFCGANYCTFDIRLVSPPLHLARLICGTSPSHPRVHMLQLTASPMLLCRSIFYTNPHTKLRIQFAGSAPTSVHALMFVFTVHCPLSP